MEEGLALPPAANDGVTGSAFSFRLQAISEDHLACLYHRRALYAKTQRGGCGVEVQGWRLDVGEPAVWQVQGLGLGF